jgi:hypothetical protein
MGEESMCDACKLITNVKEVQPEDKSKRKVYLTRA